MDIGWALLISILATWRLCHLVASEDGPFDAIARMRRLAGDGVFGHLMDCQWCLSLWFAIPFAVWMARDMQSGAVLWLAISAGSCLIGQVSALLDARTAPPVIDLSIADDQSERDQ